MICTSKKSDTFGGAYLNGKERSKKDTRQINEFYTDNTTAAVKNSG